MNFNISGDLALTDDRSDLLIVTEGESLVTRMKQGFVQFQGTWQYDLNQGLVTDNLFGRNPTEVIRQEIATFLRSFEEVTEIDEITIDPSTDRNVVVRWTVQTVYGPVEIIAPLGQLE